ncbi:MAG: hypothetical protein WAW88_12485 [Nocardioides sp.]
MANRIVGGALSLGLWGVVLSGIPAVALPAAASPDDATADAPADAPADATAATSAPAGRAAVHTIGGCSVFPEDNWWNTRLKGLPVHKRSRAIIRRQAAGHAIHLDLGVTERYYGIPINVAAADQPTRPLLFGVDGADYRSESDPGPVPFPDNAHIEGGASATDDPGSGDRHVIVVQRGSCTLIESYATERVRDDNGQVVAWRAAAVARWDLGSNRLRPKYWTSADAAGLPILPGLLTYDEAASGRITHALRFTLPMARSAFIKPARHCGPAGNTARSLPSYGMRFRLRKGFKATRYTGPARTIVKAMKRFGLMYADQGTAMYVTGTADPRWGPVLDQFRAKPIDGRNFRVVKTGKATVCR